MEVAPGLAFWPGFAIALAVYGTNMFGDAMRDLLDPRLRRRATAVDVQARCVRADSKPALHQASTGADVTCRAGRHFVRIAGSPPSPSPPLKASKIAAVPCSKLLSRQRYTSPPPE